MVDYAYVIQRDDGMFAKYDDYMGHYIWKKLICHSDMVSEKEKAQWYINNFNLLNCKVIKVKIEVVEE